MSPSVTATPWQEVVLRKRHLRDTAIAPFLSNDNSSVEAESLRILEIDDLQNLQKEYHTGTYSAEAVIKAYITQAALSHSKTNCLTEVNFENALRAARELDELRGANGNLVGPLHGVPMTLKDQFNVEGFDSTLGYVGRAFHPATEDCVLVSILKRLGAVILAKTNLPQSIMWCETENPLWGLTTSPRAETFTPGGSTGGEGALLAMRGTLVGWGTDIGGSIRIPSHINGLYGLKPSSGRLPYHGVPVSTDGQEHVPSVIGPMSRSLSSLTLTMKAVIDAQPWQLDPKCCPLPWREDLFREVQTRPLVIRVMVDDGVVRPHPPIQRALEGMVDLLKKAGHEIVEWKPEGHAECVAVADAYYASDGGEDVRRDVAVAGEPYIPHVEKLFSKGEGISVYEYWQLNKRKIAAQKAYLDRWNSTKSPISGRVMDVILCPPMPHAAVPHRACRWVGYTKVFNVLDYPAFVFPCSSISATRDQACGAVAHQPRNSIDEWNWNLYDPVAMDGHPIGLQIVARRLEEEKVLGVTAMMEQLVKAATNEPVEN
ncbi:amidase [Xylona heveae TC161]|uniref:Amidase n=1 Tax=Xylona heveae (strain CBS 132557 / TC161) TaxID=1328760 RepID=A0A165J761_XYLHT|nr:amidase [Xylona heveae TC161]KZF25831.1 amidase [Xylona heveae TC161]